MKVQITLPQGYENDKGVKGECGEVLDVYEDLAFKLIRLNMAVPAPESVVETVARAAPENTATRTGKMPKKTAAPKIPNGKGA